MPTIKAAELDRQLSLLSTLKQLKEARDELRRYDESKRMYRTALCARIARLEARAQELNAQGVAA